MNLDTLISMIFLALSAWGVSSPTPIVAHIDTIGWIPAVTAVDTSECRIYADPVVMAQYSSFQQQSIITHEVGHCLGLSHYGDCNSQPSIMGCATLGYITDYDRMRLNMQQGVIHRLYVGVTYDGQ